jgi:hypothetical protein
VFNLLSKKIKLITPYSNSNTHTQIHMHAHTHPDTHTHSQRYTQYTKTHMHTYSEIHTHTHTSRYTHKHIHPDTCTHSHRNTHSHTDTHRHTCTHSHTEIHTRTCSVSIIIATLLSHWIKVCIFSISSTSISGMNLEFWFFWSEVCFGTLESTLLLWGSPSPCMGQALFFFFETNSQLSQPMYLRLASNL